MLNRISCSKQQLLTGAFNREKKKQKNGFDLLESIHAPEFATLEAKGHIPPEPAHKFEVTLECASFSEEKYNPAACISSHASSYS
jgi:hypothetical protein